MDWNNLLSPGVFAIFMVFTMIIVSIVASYWYKVSKVNSDNELKRDMLEKGFSSEEIERVVNAGNNNDDEEEE